MTCDDCYIDLPIHLSVDLVHFYSYHVVSMLYTVRIGHCAAFGDCDVAEDCSSCAVQRAICCSVDLTALVIVALYDGDGDSAANDVDGLYQAGYDMTIFWAQVAVYVARQYSVNFYLHLNVMIAVVVTNRPRHHHACANHSNMYSYGYSLEEVVSLDPVT